MINFYVRSDDFCVTCDVDFAFEVNGLVWLLERILQIAFQHIIYNHRNVFWLQYQLFKQIVLTLKSFFLVLHIPNSVNFKVILFRSKKLKHQDHLVVWNELALSSELAIIDCKRTLQIVLNFGGTLTLGVWQQTCPKHIAFCVQHLKGPPDQQFVYIFSLNSVNAFEVFALQLRSFVGYLQIMVLRICFLA